MSQDVIFTKWNPEKVKQAVMNKLLGNAPVVGKFIEDDARRRLDAIRTPDTPRDKNYRRYLSKWILTNVVDKKGEGLVIAVGMKIGKDGQRHHGFYIETGSSTAPAHPFLRPAVTQNARDILEILFG
jgi:HK97 gp10 family phage protein